ncbi:hypothetical protein PSTT_12117 [Puccinia striiformis]|uniref:Aquaporin n=1 Tax=Puccinia striiformis TaxID=27350 RepID=A0A2S4UXF0_9BASI|nr:hypothetical protein PSTT_12117 [Puccinia striiformis]
MLSIWKATIFEGLGSMCLVWLVGASSTALGVGDSISTGLTLAILYAAGTSLSMYALGPLSGGHINPFITLATMASGTLPLVRGAAYIVAHMLGPWSAALSSPPLSVQAHEILPMEAVSSAQKIASVSTSFCSRELESHINRLRIMVPVWPLFCLDYPSASSAGIMKFQSSHWVFWLPGFVAVGGFGLLHRFLNPYEEAAREPIGIRSTMSTVNKAREIR